MQYLQSAPFTVGLGTRKFGEGWDRIWGSKQEPKSEPVEPSPDTERSTPPAEPPAGKEKTS